MPDENARAQPDFPLFGPEMLPNPDAAYRRLREQDPVHWYEPMHAWLLTRFEDIDAALRDSRLSSTWGQIPSSAGPSSGGWEVLQDLLVFLQDSLVFSDPPRHTRLRALIGQAFTPVAVEAQRPRVQAITDSLLDGVQQQGHMELLRDFASPLPITVITGMLGFALQDRDQLKRWCDDLLLPFGRAPAMLSAEERQRATKGGTALSQYVRELIRQARSRPGSDLLSALTQATDDSERLTEDELFASIVLFLIAGHENLTSLISNGVLALLQHPDQLQRLRRDESLWSQAVEELLRYVTPNQFIRRRATEDIPIGGRTIQTGESVVLVLAAADRDPAHVPDPDRLDISRPPAKHFAFGQGPHYCLGAPLARLEVEIALSTVIRRFPGLRLAADAWDYEDNFNVRLLRALPVTF